MPHRRAPHHDDAAPGAPVRATRVLLVTSGVAGTGGIERYTQWLIGALAPECELDVVDLGLDPGGSGVSGRLRGLGRGLRAWLRRPPDVVLLAHLSLGAVGLGQRLLRRPLVAIAYGMEVWGPSKPSIVVTTRLVTEIWPISSFTAGEVARAWPGTRVGPVLGGGIEESFFVERVRHGGPFRLLVVARLHDLAGKGIDTCIEAVARASRSVEAELRIVGSGRAREELDQLIARSDAHGVVRVLGSLDDTALRAEYASADVALLMSRFERGEGARGEGLGIVTLEAGAAGAPAIVTSVGGPVDTVVDGQTGLLIPPDDPEALASAIVELASDEHRRSRMGEQARRFVREVHAADRFRARVRRALAEVGPAR